MHQHLFISRIRSGVLSAFVGVFLFSQAVVPAHAQVERPGSQSRATTSSTISGCPIFPSNNYWNTPVDNLPVHARSDQWVNAIGRNTGFHMDFGSGTWDGGPIGIPYNVVGSGVPKLPVSFYYPGESDSGPYPVPSDPLIEYGSDHHILIVDNSTCILYELYDASYSGGQWHAGSGAIWDLNSNDLRPDTWTSADAAGLPILPGLVRYDEILSGEIDHAIRFTAENTNGYIWPARHLTSNDPAAPQIPPMGARFRLKASYNISGYPPAMQVILRAMKTYGIVLADNGSNWYVSGAPDEGWDNDMLHLLDDLTGNDFEAVDTSRLMLDYDSGAAGSVPGAATLTAPSGNIGTNYHPTYTWNAVSDATWYYLWINGPSGKLLAKWYDAATYCSGAICSATPDITLGGGDHTWWVQTWNSVGTGPWSTGLTFSTTIPTIPPAATLVSPNNNIATNYNPTYTWNQVSSATYYYLWVNGPSGNVIKQWYTSADANCNGTTCSVTPGTTLGGGTHTWWVQTWNPAGLGPWSAPMSFSTTIPTPPLAATLVSPNNNIATNYNPTYTWNQVSNATYYYLWVNGPNGVVIQKWYTSAEANCNGTTCSVTPTTTLGGGTHTWWVQTWNSAGLGPWSAPMSFSTTIPTKPVAATLISPAGTIANHTPTYTWNQISNATWYYLWVNGPGGVVIQQWYTSAQANCNGSTCSMTPAVTLTSGSHTWWIQTWNSAGTGPWSAATRFGVP